MADANTLQVAVEIQNNVTGLDQENAQLAAIRTQVEGINASQATGLDLVAGMTAGEEARAAAVEKQAAIESQLQVIAQTRLDLVAAQTAGDTARVEVLQGELAIRSAVLGVMRQETFSMAELNALGAEEAALLATTAKETEATGVAALLAGANLNRAKGEAMVLGREIATGSVNSRTLGALLGALGPTLTIAAIAGFALFEMIKSAVKDATKLDEETAKEADNLFKQVDAWHQLAIEAGNFQDILKIGEGADKVLDPLLAKLDAARQKEEQFQQAAQKYAADTGGGDPYAVLGTGTGEVDQRAQLVQKALESSQQELQVALQSKEAWESIQLKPVAEAVDEVTQKVTELSARTEQLHQQSILPKDATPGQIAAAALAFDQYVNALKEYSVWLERLKTLQTKEFSAEDTSAKDAETEKRREVNELLKQEEATLQGIRQQEELISKNPFLGAGDKEAQQHTLALQEQATVMQEIEKSQAEIDKLKAIGDPADQASIDQLTKKLQQLRTEYQLLGFEIQKTTFTGALKADLANWVNSWGSASHQIAQTITTSIGDALQGINQYIVTGQLNVQQLLQQFELLALKLIEQLALQQAASLLGITTTTAASTAAGAETAIAWGPAAAAVSTATFGASADSGSISELAAISAIEGALGVAHEGGVVGSNLPRWGGGALASDERLVVTKVGETILPTHRGARRFHDGDPLEPPDIPVPGPTDIPYQGLDIIGVPSWAQQPSWSQPQGGWAGGQASQGGTDIANFPTTWSMGGQNFYYDSATGQTYVYDANWQYQSTVPGYTGTSATVYGGGGFGGAAASGDAGMPALQLPGIDASPMPGYAYDSQGNIVYVGGDVGSGPTATGGLYGGALGTGAFGTPDSFPTGFDASGNPVPMVPGGTYYDAMGNPISNPGMAGYSDTWSFGSAPNSQSMGTIGERPTQFSAPGHYKQRAAYTAAQMAASAGFTAGTLAALQSDPNWLFPAGGGPGYYAGPPAAALAPSSAHPFHASGKGPLILHSGGSVLGHDEVPLIGQVGEFMHSRRAVDHYGVDAMHAINSLRVPRDQIKFHDGGPIGSSVGGAAGGGGNLFKIDVHAWTDSESLKNAIINSDANKQFVIDTVSGSAHEVGIGG